MKMRHISLSILLICFISCHIPIIHCSLIIPDEFENDITWSKPWTHKTTKKGLVDVVNWKKVDIIPYYLQDAPAEMYDGWINASDSEWKFVKDRTEEMLKVARQVVLKVRQRKEGTPLVIPRHCVGRRSGEKRATYCQTPKEQCSKYGRCYDVPVPANHSGECRHEGDAQHNPKYKNGAGLEEDLILYITIAQCEGEIANAVPCQYDPQFHRPMAGRIAFCYDKIKNYMKTPKQYERILLHEIFHILLWPLDGSRYVRKDDGQLLSNTYKFAPRLWRSASGNFMRDAFLSTLPSVLAVAREHFNCPELEGVELDNSSKHGEYTKNTRRFGHFEARLFPETLMTPLYNPGVALSKLDVAMLKDTGWYEVDESMGRNLTVTRGKGCEFATKSCYDYMNSVNFDRVAMYPYCDVKDSRKWMCSLDNRQTGYCNGEESSEMLSDEYHVQTTAQKFISHYMYEYCPMVIPQRVAEDSSPYCKEDSLVDYHRFMGTQGDDSDSQCVRFETLKVKKSSRCRKVDEKIIGLCVKSTCTTDSMIFQFGGQKFTCMKDESGKRINFNFATTPNDCHVEGSFCCPDFETFCSKLANFTTPVLRFQYCSASVITVTRRVYFVSMLFMFSFCIT